MKKPTTVKELIDHAIELGACIGQGSGPAYLAKLGHEDVVRAGVECDQHVLLIWYLGRVDPSGIVAFARRCAARAGGFFCAYAGAAAARAARVAECGYAADVAIYATDAAIYASDSQTNADTIAVERAAQLEDLHAMWRAWFADGA